MTHLTTHLTTHPAATISSRSRRRGVAAVAVLCLALSGCGSDSDDAPSGGSTTTAPGGAGDPAVSADFQQCLEDQGVALPDAPPTDGGQPSLDPGLQEAFEACASLAPEGLEGGPGDIDQSALDAFADCMSSHDVEVDASLDAVTALDSTKPTVAEALETCSSLIQP